MESHPSVKTLLRPHARLLASAAMASLVFRLLPLQVPVLAGAMIDGLSGQPVSVWGWAINSASAASLVQTLGLLLTAAAAATAATAYLSSELSSRLGRNVNRELKGQTIQAWHQTSFRFRDEFGVVRFSSRILRSAGSVAGRFTDVVVEGVAITARLLYPMAMLLAIDALLALIPLGFLALQTILTHLAQVRESRFAEALQEAKTVRDNTTLEAIHGVETIQALHSQDFMKERLAETVALVDEHRKLSGAYPQFLNSAAWGFAAAGLALSWWVGGARVAAGEISLGHLVAFAGFVSLQALPLRRLTSLAGRLRSAIRELSRVQQFLVSAADGRVCRGTAALNPRPSGIELRDVCFQFRGATVLDAVSANIPAGAVVWLRGASGSGKSTLLRLLAGLDLPDQGAILLGNQDLRECDAESVRRSIAYVPQRAFVFSGTLAANLKLACPSANQEEMEAACALAGLTPLLNSLEARLDTTVGEYGLKLSAAEAHLLAVARALIVRPPVLLLDEVTAPLDEETELKLLANLSALDCTVVIAAHKLRSLFHIQRVLELRGGRVTEWSAHPDRSPIERSEQECPSN